MRGVEAKCTMADRSDYLPASRLQELAQAIDPKLQLEADATKVGGPS